MTKSKYTYTDGSNKIKVVEEDSKAIVADNYYAMLSTMFSNPSEYFVYPGNYGVEVTFLNKANKRGFHPIMSIVGKNRAIIFKYGKYVDGEFEQDPANIRVTFKESGLNVFNIGMGKKGKLLKINRKGYEPEATQEVDEADACF